MEPGFVFGMPIPDISKAGQDGQVDEDGPGADG